MTATRECRASKLRPESVLAATSFDPAYFYIEKNKVKINTFKNYGLYRKLAAACLFFIMNRVLGAKRSNMWLLWKSETYISYEAKISHGRNCQK